MLALRSGRIRLLSRLALLGAALASCTESATAPPTEPVSVTLSPAGSLELVVGESHQLVASVRNASDPGVRFTTTDAAVATVGEGGLVSARGVGLATIIAASVQDTSARAAVAVRVTAVRLPGDGSTAAIVVEGVFGPSGAALDPARVQGTVSVRLAVRPGSARRAVVRVAGVEVCSEPLSGSETSLACELDTAAADPVSGEPRFRNGPAVVTAELQDAAGAALATARTDPYRLANPNTIRVALSTPTRVTDAQGRTWHDGDLTVTALPVVYDAASPVAAVTFTYAAPGGEILLRADSTAPFQAIFPESALPAAGGLRGVTDPSLRVAARSVTAANGSGPQAVSEPLRYDNQPPPVGALEARAWVGAGFPFAEAYRTGGEDAGVGGVTLSFFAGDPAASAAELVARGTPVSTGGDLEASSRSDAYRVAGRVCDALDNCALVPGFTFGVDLQPPVLVGTGVPDRAVNPDRDLALAVRDDGSGVGARPYLVSVRWLRPGAAAPECGPTVEGRRLPGRAAGAECLPDTLDFSPPVPRAAAGYFVYSVEVVDRAGNRTPPTLLRLLVDRTPPTARDLAFPSSLVGGREAVFTGLARDDVDLHTATFRLVFPAGPGRLAIPFASEVVIGERFDDRIDTEAPVSVSFPFVRTLTYPTLPGRPTVLVDSVRLQVTDVAGQSATTARAIPRESLESAATTEPFPGISAVTAAVDNTLACTLGCVAGDLTRTTLVVEARGPGGARRPFEQVHFFLQGSDGQVSRIGATSASATREIGGETVFSYSFAFSPPAGLRGTLSLFAIGVNGAGAGIKSPGVPVVFFIR